MTNNFKLYSGRFSFLLFLYFIHILFGCNSPEIDNVIKIDINSKIKPNTEDLFSKIEFVPLESNKESIVGQIGSIEFHEDLYYILDFHDKKIKVFDSLGIYKHSIGRVGKGPGEYVILRDFFIEDSNVYLLTLDPDKLLIYSINGNYIRSLNLPNALRTSKYFYKVNQHGFLFFSMMSDAEVFYYDTDKDYLKNLLPKIPEQIPRRTIFNPQNNLFYSDDENIFYYQFYTNNIYKLDNELNLVKYYRWDFGKYNFDIFEDLNYEQINNNTFVQEYSDDYAFYFFNVIETDDNLYAQLIHNNNNLNIIFDMKSRNSMVFNSFENDKWFPLFKMERFKDGLFSIIQPNNLEYCFNNSNKIMQIDESSINNAILIKYYKKDEIEF
jgi:hypothetical protein